MGMRQFLVTGITMMMAGAVHAWTCSPREKEIGVSEETFTITVVGSENLEWFAGSQDAWISVIKDTSKSFTVKIQQNAGTEERYGVVTVNAFKAGGPYNATTWVNNSGCRITQAGMGSGVSGDTPGGDTNETLVTPKSMVMTADGGVTSVVVKADGEWKVENSLSWISVDRVEGVGDGSITVTVSENTERGGRSGLLVIADKTVALYQGGRIVPCGVSNVVARQHYPFSGKVDVSYCVFGDIVRNAQEAGRSVALELSAEDIQTGNRYVANEIVGDLLLTPGEHSVVWDLEKQGIVIDSNQVVFSVACKDSAPLYCIVDLSSGGGSNHYPVTYTNEIPGGTWTDEYRTKKLALRRLEPGTFALGNDKDNEITLTHPFYVSVFEMSQAQWSRIDYEQILSGMTPVGLWYSQIRGGDLGSGWPHSSNVDSDSLVGKLRDRTGMKFDLLTYAQWVYAYGAGETKGSYWSASYAWCNPYSRDTYKVGSLLPNGCGLYDMSGNVDEWVLDRTLDGEAVNRVYAGFDPVGHDSMVMRDQYGNDKHLRIVAGGCTIDAWLTDPTLSMVGDYAKSDGSDRGKYHGVRLGLNVDQPSVFLDGSNENSQMVFINTVGVTHAPRIGSSVVNDFAAVDIEWESDWTLYYTTDGSTPDATSAVYVEALALSAYGAKTIKAIAISSEGMKSEVATLDIPAPNAPTIAPGGRTVLSASTSVNITCDNPDATIYCTTDGTEPTTSSPVYKRFKASKKMTVKAIAVVDGMAWSETATAEYALGQCEDPVITPSDGSVFGSSNYQVSIAKNGEKGVLRYTIDGADPTEESPVYMGPFTISETTMVKAKTFDDEYFDSDVVVATLTRQWTKVETPIVVAPTSFSGAKLSVSLTCATEGAVIRYTTDGSEPNSHSKKYTGAFDVTATTTIRVIAFKTDCTASDIADVTITKLWCIGDALNSSDQPFATDGTTGWVRDAATSHDGSESMKSGAIEDSAAMGVYAISTLSTVVDGRGTVRFWWKASCEEDEEYEWDHGEFRVDGVTVEQINGAKGWTEVSFAVESPGSHTLAWVYCKDDFGGDGDDCIWVDDFSWQAEQEAIPDLGENPTAEQIAAALSGSTDARLEQNITDGVTYDKYRTWAEKVKPADGVDPIGAAAVKASPNAWLSFALDSDRLVETTPKDGDVEIKSFTTILGGDKFELAVGVNGVYVGAGAVAENLAKIFGLEGGEEIGEMSSDKVGVTFDVPTGGRVRMTAGPKGGVSPSVFFMRVKMTP